MKQILSAKYRHFVLYMEIFAAILLLPVLYNFVPVNHGTKTFYIPSSNIDDVVRTLKENGYAVTFIDRFMLKLLHTPEKGWYSVEPDKHGRLLFFEHLYREKAKTMEVVVYAGETAEELVTRLAGDMKLNKEKLLGNYRELTRFREADIFAQHYTVARKANENTTMKYLFDLSADELTHFEKAHFSQKADTFTLKVLLTIASIIQKESNSVKEMPLISSVIHNRLDKGMKLQMDSTLNYGEHSHIIVTPERIKSDRSYYNTYKYKGLPPYPLGTVTLDALKAAMSPQKSDYLFFMLNKKGEHAFAATYDEHLANIRAFRKYQKEKKKKKGKSKKS
ncbi:MAG: hypothetical protein P794_08180 [Epsilonproteobacteria bacterium (ex Lamellibrachia satsuma)]|nr:MAG: hypothetical protein P794_08180 [Epsilonproteobacteria bacterium (ex Lamellibrachia satsuma)]